MPEKSLEALAKEFKEPPRRSSEKWDEYLIYRRKLRDSKPAPFVFTPSRSPSPTRTSTSSKQRRSPSPKPKKEATSSSSKKDKSRRKRTKSRSPSRSPRREKRSPSSVSRSPSPSSSSDSSSSSSSSSEDERKTKRRKHSSHKSSRKNDSSVEAVWIEKSANVEDDNDAPIGPVPLPKIESGSYGRELLPGEGDAIARFIKENKRIPRRGEVGLSQEQIQKFEDSGFVMSGSRNKRMTAVRIRKESQVYSAEEKRQMLQQAMEEKAKRENKIVADFRGILAQKINRTDQNTN